MCNNCIHKAVCSIYRATGGVKKCEHFKEERKGKWVLIEKAGVDYWCCSVCGEIRAEYYFKPKDKYCPNCGADMMEEPK